MARSLQDWVGDSDSSQNNRSWLARLGGFGQQYTDPLYWIFGDKYTDKLIGFADKSNSFLSKVAKQDPVVQFDRRNNPLQDTPEGKKAGDWAENKPLDTAAMVLGGLALGGALGGGAAGGSSGGAGLGSGAAAPSVSGFMPGSAASGAAGLEGVTVLGSSGGAAMTPGTAAAMAAAGAGAPAAQSQGWDWQKALQNMPQGGGQQQQQMAPPPSQTAAGRPSFIDRMRSGLGRVGENMFPIDKGLGMSPEQERQMRRAAIMQAGLGMMAASGQGAGFGEAAAFGLGGAQRNLTGALQRGYENAREARQEQRQADRDRVADERFEKQFEYQQAHDEQQLEQRRLEQEEMSGYRDQMIDMQKAQMENQRKIAEMRMSTLQKPPPGYRWTPEGRLDFIPGGPADPEVLARKSNPDGKLTEGEQRALSYVTRMKNAETNLAKTGYTPQGAGGVLNVVASMAPGGNLVVSENFQKYQASAREWIAGMLRYDSGAAVPETEFRRYFNTWFAQPGDSAETIAQKEQQRQVASQSIESGLSPAALNRIPRTSGKWMIEEVD